MGKHLSTKHMHTVATINHFKSRWILAQVFFTTHLKQQNLFSKISEFQRLHHMNGTQHLKYFGKLILLLEAYKCFWRTKETIFLNDAILESKINSEGTQSLYNCKYSQSIKFLERKQSYWEQSRSHQSCCGRRDACGLIVFRVWFGPAGPWLFSEEASLCNNVHPRIRNAHSPGQWEGIPESRDMVRSQVLD